MSAKPKIMLDEYWLWKLEPTLPNGASSLGVNPNWLSIDHNLLENAVNTDDLILYDESNARNEVINKLFDSSNQIKDEPLQDWLEEKVNFPIYGNTNNDQIQQCVNPAKVIPEPHLRTISQQKWATMAQIELNNIEAPDLLEEFDNLLSADKSCPQFQPMVLNADLPTPTINQEELYALVMQDPSLLNSDISLLNSDTSSYIEDQLSTSASSPHSSVVSEEMPVPSWDIDHFMDSSDCQDARSDEEEQSKSLIKPAKQEQEDTVDEDTEDIYIKDECILSPSSESNISESIDSTETSNDDPDWSRSTTSRKSTRKYTRTQPYTRKPYVKVSPAERKVRKKEQNKNAATRYRQKKKQEVLEIVNEESLLLEKNKDLTEKVTDVEREVKYLKQLLRDLYTAKGLIK